MISVMADVTHILWHLPQHWNGPALAWHAAMRGQLPGPAGMYATFTGLIGGISVRIGDRLYDASVRSRLERLRARLTAV